MRALPLRWMPLFSKIDRSAYAAFAVSFIYSLLVGLFLSGSTLAQGQDGPDGVRIKSVAHHGSGCRSGTTDVYVSDDAQVMTIIFDEYVLDTSSLPGQRRRAHVDCQISIQLEASRGWTFGIWAVDFRGFAALDAGVVGTQRTRYIFPGRGNGVEVGQMVLRGPLVEDYLHHDQIDAGRVDWANCKSQAKKVMIKTRLEIDRRPPAQGLLTVDTVDQELSQAYQLVWKKCDS